MIAYCCNNPVNNIDPDGHSVIASILLNVLVDGGINAMMILMQGGSIHDAIGAALETIPSAVFEGLSPQWVVLVYNFISASFKSWKSGKSVGESLFIGAVSVLTSVSLPNSLDEDLYKALEPLLGIEQTIVSTALNQYTGEYDITPEETPPLIISAVGGGSYAGGIILTCVHLM